MKKNDHTAAFAEAVFIGNLLFVGLFYIALWALYLFNYKKTSAVGKNHLKQSLMASSFSSVIFVSLNINIVLNGGYKTLLSIFSLELYFMILVPLFLVFGILGFSKAIKGLSYYYPLIGRLLK